MKGAEKNLEKFGKIWKNLEKFGKIWKNLEKFGKIWKNLEKFVSASNERQLSRDSPLLQDVGGTVSRLVIEIVHTNTIVQHTN